MNCFQIHLCDVEHQALDMWIQSLRVGNCITKRLGIRLANHLNSFNFFLERWESPAQLRQWYFERFVGFPIPYFVFTRSRSIFRTTVTLRISRNSQCIQQRSQHHDQCWRIEVKVVRKCYKGKSLHCDMVHRPAYHEDKDTNEKSSVSGTLLWTLFHLMEI